MPLSFWAFPQDAERGLPKLEQDARGAFEFFSDRVGPYVYDKLAHVQAAGMGGGMESTTNIFYGEKSVAAGNTRRSSTRPRTSGSATAVTESDWNDVWLSEGFATYFTLLYTEYAAGREAFVDGLRRSRDNVLRLEKAQPNTPVVHANFKESGNRRRTRVRVSERRLDAAHAARSDRHGRLLARHPRLLPRAHERPGNDGRLPHAMEAESGQDLGPFFTQWLTRSGVPAIEGTWRYDAAAKNVVDRTSSDTTGLTLPVSDRRRRHSGIRPESHRPAADAGPRE